MFKDVLRNTLQRSPNWKQLECPSVGEGTIDWVPPHAGILYSTEDGGTIPSNNKAQGLSHVRHPAKAAGHKEHVRCDSGHTMYTHRQTEVCCWKPRPCHPGGDHDPGRPGEVFGGRFVPSPDLVAD